MNTVAFYKERFDQMQSRGSRNGLAALRQDAFNVFSRLGIPTVKNEEWKYTRIGGLFNNEYQFPAEGSVKAITSKDIDPFRLPGHENANELIFVNGLFSLSLSRIHSADLVVQPLEEAEGNEYKEIVSTYLGHSSQYLKDGINALNTAFVHGGAFIHVKKGKIPQHPLYIYHITHAGGAGIFSQPRSLVHISEGAQIQLVETYLTLGSGKSFTNQVMEIVAEQDARVEYYKIQNDSAEASQVSTTHIRQVGRCYTHTVTISLNGAIIRNNLNVLLEAPNCEAHLYGLYFQGGKTHVDNHTIVDNEKPNAFSNELYKGIMTEDSTAVFNGKIFVRPQAQKTNAYQSNKNVLLSDSASVNTKPQLEIFADDVKCSHGCTVGQLDEEALFYLRSRGIGEKVARSLLVSAFAADILEHIGPAAIRSYVEQLISERLALYLS